MKPYVPVDNYYDEEQEETIKTNKINLFVETSYSKEFLYIKAIIGPKPICENSHTVKEIIIPTVEKILAANNFEVTMLENKAIPKDELTLMINIRRFDFKVNTFAVNAIPWFHTKTGKLLTSIEISNQLLVKPGQTMTLFDYVFKKNAIDGVQFTNMPKDLPAQVHNIGERILKEYAEALAYRLNEVIPLQKK